MRTEALGQKDRPHHDERGARSASHPPLPSDLPDEKASRHHMPSERRVIAIAAMEIASSRCRSIISARHLTVVVFGSQGIVGMRETTVAEKTYPPVRVGGDGPEAAVCLPVRRAELRFLRDAPLRSPIRRMQRFGKGASGSDGGAGNRTR